MDSSAICSACGLRSALMVYASIPVQLRAIVGSIGVVGKFGGGITGTDVARAHHSTAAVFGLCLSEREQVRRIRRAQPRRAQRGGKSTLRISRSKWPSGRTNQHQRLHAPDRPRRSTDRPLQHAQESRACRLIMRSARRMSLPPDPMPAHVRREARNGLRFYLHAGLGVASRRIGKLGTNVRVGLVFAALRCGGYRRGERRAGGGRGCWRRRDIPRRGCTCRERQCGERRTRDPRPHGRGARAGSCGNTKPCNRSLPSVGPRGGPGQCQKCRAQGLGARLRQARIHDREDRGRQRRRLRDRLQFIGKRQARKRAHLCPIEQHGHLLARSHSSQCRST